MRVYNPDGSLKMQFLAYGENFLGGVHVATGDVTGDGVPDIVTGAGPGAFPDVRVFDGNTGQILRQFFAYGENVTGGEDEVLLAAVLDLGAAVLAVDDLVADLDVERDALVAVLVPAAGADGEDLALLRLLLRRVRNDEAGGGGLLRLEGLDDDAVFERLDGNRHGGDLPFGMSMDRV